MPQDDWSFIHSETLRDFRVLSLREDRYRFNPTGSETGFSPDPFEQIEIDLRPLTSVTQMINNGELQHALCIAAFAVTGVHSQ